MAKTRALACCVCDGEAGHFEQHWNRDTGYGICRNCVDWEIKSGTDAATLRDYYGIEGVNYATRQDSPAA